MAQSARHFFARGNTARGVHSLYDSAFQGLRKIFLLDGYPGSGKSTVLQRIADDLTSKGQAVDLFHSPLNPDDLDALIIKDLQMGIADGRTCEGLDSLSDVELVRIDLGQAADVAQFSEETKQEIAALHTEMQKALSNAYESFAAALRIHDEWEAIYIEKMDFRKADQIGQELISALFGDQSPDKKATVRHLFFGAATPKGAVDHIQTLTAHLDRRIFIKGRPGSGKSTLLKRLAAAAAAQGLDVEVFHCGFDPNSLDMLIFPALSLAIFDSTAPHEYFPSQPSDEILDMYELAMAPGTDEEYAGELKAIQQRYSQKMQEATAYLTEAQRLHAGIKVHYTGVTDFERVASLVSDLIA
ncbi:MAG TPA: PRK06851 family protein [Symbiobacteriaceae bacterium]|nr:PRK06851 family protein [Symbiobacteriaceae bacterium]